MTKPEPTVHRCVGLLICDDDRVLLAKRSATKRWYPSCWDVIGGHIEPGETPLEALCREAAEELAIDLDPADVSVVDTVEAADVELTVFTATAWNGTPVNVAPEEHDDIAWKTLAEIAGLELADPAINQLAARALEINAGKAD